MKYKDRKICGLINLHSMVSELRCPHSKAEKGASCEGCELFETYVKFKERSTEMRDNQ